MNNEQLAAQLVIDEGRKKRIYTDTVGKVTAGVGRNLTDRDFSDDEIDLMLSNDINMVCDQLDNALPWWKQLSDRRQQALANMCFNMGVTTLLKFKNSLQLLRIGSYAAAADAFMDSQWAKQVGQRAVRVTTMIREG